MAIILTIIIKFIRLEFIYTAYKLFSRLLNSDILESREKLLDRASPIYFIAFYWTHFIETL